MNLFSTFYTSFTSLILELGAPQFAVEEITEHSMNVTWAPDANFGGTVVHYVEFRKEGTSKIIDSWLCHHLKSGEQTYSNILSVRLLLFYIMIKRQDL